MANETSLVQVLAGAALARVEDEAAQRGIRVIIGSNVSPEVVAFDAREDGSLLTALGVKAYARVEDSAGNVIATYGSPGGKDIGRAIALWGTLAFVLLYALKGLTK
jgi:hypothetical protein